MKNKKSKKSKRSPARRVNGLGGFTEWYNPNDRGPYKNAGQSAKQGAFEIVSAIAGAFLSSLAGSKAGIASGVLLVGVGNYFDKTGLLKSAGTGALAYAIAKSLSDKYGLGALGEPKTTKERALAFKDELLAAFYIDKLIGKKEQSGAAVSGFSGSEDEMGALDMGAFDMFDDFNQQQASNFAQESQMFGDFGDIDFAYSVIDEQGE